MATNIGSMEVSGSSYSGRLSLLDVEISEEGVDAAVPLDDPAASTYEEDDDEQVLCLSPLLMRA